MGAETFRDYTGLVVDVAAVRRGATAGWRQDHSSQYEQRSTSAAQTTKDNRKRVRLVHLRKKGIKNIYI